MKKEIGYDKRPRFGYTDDFDKDPQIIREKSGHYCVVRFNGDGSKRYEEYSAVHPCVVIPLPNLKSATVSFARHVGKLFSALLGWPP
jgi:hypothetical protein